MPSQLVHKRPLDPRPSPGALVAREVARSLGDGLLLPLRACGQFLEHDARLDQVRHALSTRAPLAPDDRELVLPARPLRIFLSCAEASGETHALNLVVALRAVLAEQGAPEPELLGLGGKRLATAGVRTLGDPVAQARMGFGGVLGALPFYLGLVRDAAAAHAEGTIDIFVGVDSPALNVPLAHVARSCGATTVQYITPQLWGWAPWRVGGFRQAVDRALTILPFEADWFSAHGVEVEHVGHPLLDALDPAPPVSPPGHSLAILPGSRASVIERNLPLMLRCAAPHLEAEGWSARISCSDPRHRARIDALLGEAELHRDRFEVVDGLEAALDGAGAALSVSGTVLIHLLQRRLPAVVVYRLEGALQAWMGRHFLTVPHFSSVNLLAGRELYPEFSFAGQEPPAALGQAVERLLGDAPWRAACAAGLDLAAERLGPAGASRRAALSALSALDPAPRP